MWAAANRPSPGDPLEPEAEQGVRGPAPHRAFGRGTPVCIGAHLARFEVTIALEQLLSRTAAFTLDPDRPSVRRPSIFLRRHVSLPIRLRCEAVAVNL